MIYNLQRPRIIAFTAIILMVLKFNPQNYDVNMFMGFKIGSSVSCKQRKFRSKIHSKMKYVDVIFLNKNINGCSPSRRTTGEGGACL